MQEAVVALLVKCVQMPLAEAREHVRAEGLHALVAPTPETHALLTQLKTAENVYDTIWRTNS